MPPPPEENKQASAQVAVDLLWEISQILVSKPPGPHARPSNRDVYDRVLTTLPPTQNCHLDRREISICTSLIERGVNPEALATTIKELRKGAQETKIELESRKQQQQQQQ